MFDRAQIEQILKLNGLTPLAKDEEIRSVLLSSRWNKHDVEEALTVLRENSKTHETQVDSLHQFLRSEGRMSPDTISALLGIDMSVSPEEVQKQRQPAFRESHGALNTFMVVLLAVFSAALFIFTVMWKMKIGMFYPGV